VPPAAGDDEQDLEGFCRDVYPQLVGLLQLRGHELHRAEELAQDALLKVVEHWSRVVQMENPRGWAVRCALNAGTSSWRRLIVERRANQRQATQPAPAAAALDQRTADRLAVHAALGSLPPRQRDTLIVRHFLGMSVDEAAEVLRCSPGTVKSNNHKALASLRASGVLDDEPVEEVQADA
jgi:RNA polymerase sigma factor (sigma-70 family)